MCGGKKEKRNKTCSKACGNKRVRKFEVSEKELRDLISSHSYEAIGRMFGVTGMSIKDRAKRLNIL
jgi:hypothetical protein